MRYLIDIDGTTLTQYAPGDYDKAKPLENAVSTINRSFDEGHQIVFYTNRNFKFMQMTYEQLRAFGFKFHHIDFSKPHADLIIDDRARQFTNWLDLKKQGII